MKSILRAAGLAATSLLLAACATAPHAAPLGVGDWVLARWQDDQTWYFPAVVTAREGDVLTMQYDDGDTGSQPAANVRSFDWQAGTRLECRWTDGVFYPAVIAQMDPGRYRIEVLYDDGDKRSTDTSQCRGR